MGEFREPPIAAPSTSSDRWAAGAVQYRDSAWFIAVQGEDRVAVWESHVNRVIYL